MRHWSSSLHVFAGVFAVAAVLTTPVSSAQSAVWRPSPGHTQVPIWTGSAPNAINDRTGETVEVASNLVAGKPWFWVTHVSQPTMTVYPPTAPNTGAAIIVFPGGGYTGLAIDLEGSEVCGWLTARGLTCVLLKYRVPDPGPAWHDDCHCNIRPKAPTALQDAQRTVRLVRHQATTLGIDPLRIGVLGFSAGGHLVADVSTHFTVPAYAPVDKVDEASSRPDFAVAVYPGHLREHTTRAGQLNPTIPVTTRTPPTFLVQAKDDPVDSVENSRVYFSALRQAGVPAELHVFPAGGHAFGLRRTSQPITRWPELLLTWLRSRELISR